MSIEPQFPATQDEAEDTVLTLHDVIELMIEQLSDGLDHPELWADMPTFIDHFPLFLFELDNRLRRGGPAIGELAILNAVAVAAAGDPARGVELLEPIAVANSLLPVVQGAMFHIQGLLDPNNPKYDLSDRFCSTPFVKFDVLDGSTHQCCASWIQQSAGDLGAAEKWQDVWNSEMAQNIRASILDGSYRYCNKTACPIIGANNLMTREKAVATSEKFRDIIENDRTEIVEGPERVTLAYDMTCNLSCPSCRTGKIASDAAKREQFDRLQENAILPMLRNAKLVDITGSGDPFASKNFRRLMEKLTKEEYPDLGFLVMTNGMLLTPREWDRFPALHGGRTTYMRVSLDAATGPTHELLRRGARWPVMEENLAFIRDLRLAGEIGHLTITFVVQVDNYREMGDAVDLGRHYAADAVDFLRVTNWGTFTNEQYARAAVFMPSHPQYADFIEAMQDPRLREAPARLNDLRDFVRWDEAAKAA